MEVAQLNNQQIYYFELGKFVSQFALAESAVFLFLSHLIAVDRNILNAITSGIKIDGCCNFIRRIYEATNAEIPKEIDDCLSRLVTINSLRNDLLHRGADSSLTITNAIRALPTRVETYQLEPDSIPNASFDIAKIVLVLLAHANADGLTAPEVQIVNDILSAPWRYKPPQSKKTHQKSQSIFQKQPPPQKS